MSRCPFVVSVVRLSEVVEPLVREPCHGDTFRPLHPTKAYAWFVVKGPTHDELTPPRRLRAQDNATIHLAVHRINTDTNHSQTQ